MKKMMMVSLLTILSLTSMAEAATLKCDLKLVHADEKMAAAGSAAMRMKIQGGEAEVADVVDRRSGSVVGTIVMTNGKVKGVFGVDLNQWPSANTTSNVRTSGSVLLMAQGTVAEETEEEALVPPKGNKTDILLSLHPYAHMSPALSAVFIPKAVLTTLRDLGYKGPAVVTSPFDYDAVDSIVKLALSQNKLMPTDLVAFGFESNCSMSK